MQNEVSVALVLLISSAKCRYVHSQTQRCEQNSIVFLIRSALLSWALHRDQPTADIFRELFPKEGATQKSVIECTEDFHHYLLTISLLSSDLGGKIYLADFDNKRTLIEGKKELVNSDLEVTFLQINAWLQISDSL